MGGIHEGGVRVPAVVVWPGVTKPGSQNETRIQALLINHLANARYEIPQDRSDDGVDFTEALRGAELGGRRCYVSPSRNTPHWLPPSMSVHVGDWKLICTFYYGGITHKYRLRNLQDDIEKIILQQTIRQKCGNLMV